MRDTLRLDKLDFDALHDEAVRAKRHGICPICEFDGDTTDRLLCFCGVCLKYHHLEYFHEDIVEDYPSECFGPNDIVAEVRA